MSLLSLLVSWAMYYEAKSLYEVLSSSKLFATTPAVDAYFKSLSSDSIIEKLIESARDFESKNGFVPDAFIMAAFEPFLRIQDHQNVTRLYRALNVPSVTASNLYLKSLLQARQFSEAHSLFNLLLRKNALSHHRIGANGYTFAIFMQHYAETNEINKLLSVAETLFARHYGPPKSIHFEIIFKALVNSQRNMIIRNMIDEMIKANVLTLDEKVAVGVMEAMVESGEYSHGARFHLLLQNTDEWTSYRYFKALKICVTSTAIFPEKKLKIINAKLAELSPADASMASSSSSKSSSTSNHPQYGAINTFILETARRDDFALSSLEKLFSVVENMDFASMLPIWSVMVHHQASYVGSELALALLDVAVKPEQLKVALNAIQEASIEPTEEIWAHHMRYYALSAIHSNGETDYQRLFKSITRTYRQYEEKQLVPTWDVQRWRLKALYHMHQGKVAAQILEKLLPTSAQIMQAPASAFTLEAITPHQFSKKRHYDLRRKNRGFKARTVEPDNKDETTQFRVPASIAADFYAWSSLLEPEFASRNAILRESEELAAYPASSTLSAGQLRALLAAVQIGCRQPPKSPFTKNGWKARYHM